MITSLKYGMSAANCDLVTVPMVRRDCRTCQLHVRLAGGVARWAVRAEVEYFVRQFFRAGLFG